MYYLNNSLHIFLSYYQATNFPLLCNKKTKHQKIQNIQTIFYKSNLNFHNISYKKTHFEKNLFTKIINKNLEINLIIKKFLETLSNFTSNKFKIFLIIKSLNNNIKKTAKKKNTFFQKKLVNLRKYKQTEFFQEGINILFTCTTNRKSSKLLAQFIATQLSNLKQHNFFLRFIKNVLTLFGKSIFSKCKGIKIKVSGRLNGRPRARSRVIQIMNNIPILTINSSISYSNETAFTANGTLGVKVWIQEF